MARKKTATKKKAASKGASKKAPAKKTGKKVIDEPVKSIFYKLGDLIDDPEILEEAAARTKKNDPMPFDIQWETDDELITLHILGGVALEKKKK